jgi:hypothetical protein
MALEMPFPVWAGEIMPLPDNDLVITHGSACITAVRE